MQYDIVRAVGTVGAVGADYISVLLKVGVIRYRRCSMRSRSIGAVRATTTGIMERLISGVV